MTKQTQAISLLQTWLDECSIPYSADSTSLKVRKADGSSADCSFDPHKVMSTDMNVALGEFHKLTNEAGYGTPTPVNRGKPPKHRRLFKDNILARWRHNELRTVPNASAADLAAFSQVARREAHIFISRNRLLCNAMGYDHDVAYNDALLWTNIFLGRYRIRREDPAQAETENKKLLTNFLRQRFLEVSKSLAREERNVIPSDAYASHMNEYGEAPDDEWKEAHDEIKILSPQLRRNKVKELLNKNFTKMGHDQMIAALTQTSQDHPCHDTRRVAKKYLKSHASECDSCASLEVEVE